MEIEFDDNKSQRNIRNRGLAFECVADFNFETALITEDTRRDYGETRYRAFGFVHDRLHALVFTETAAGIRVISFRKANPREVKRYARSTQT